MNDIIIYRDDHLVVVDKKSGMHVHPPENKEIRVQWNRILMYQIKKILKQKVYPVHRLDVATSGLLVFALSSEVASKLCLQFQEQNIKKKYLALVRGYTPDTGTIDQPLALDTTGELVPALTRYRCLNRIEIDEQVSPKYPKARYSLVEVEPHTGRYHQIRRHFNRISHPIIGDNAHGDSYHNRYFRNQKKIEGLCLRAHSLQFQHPISNAVLEWTLPHDEKWQQILQLFT